MIPPELVDPLKVIYSVEPPSGPRPLRHYCAVRSDLSAGLKAAMFIHAAGESAILGTGPDSETNAVAIEATEAEMIEALAALKKRNFKVSVFVETEGEHTGQMLAFGIEPTRDNRVSKILYHFRKVGS